MKRARAGDQAEYLCKEEARNGAHRRPDDRMVRVPMADRRGDFSFGGHWLSSLYRRDELEMPWLRARYFLASSLRKYSSSTFAGVPTPDRLA